MELGLKWQQDSPALLLGPVKVKDEPVDFGFQQLELHLSEGIIQPPEMTFSTTTNSTTTTVKDEPDEITEFDSPERPRKRLRVVMDVVLVPTLAEVRRKKDANDDDLTKLKKLFKPKKKKAAELTLNNAILMSRLKPVGLDTFPVHLPLAELNQMVSRHFMASTYGGSMQATFPSIGSAFLAQHGMNDFMYLHLKYHPYAPQIPGGSGLWFDPEWYDPPCDGVYRVFTRDWDKAIWQYMGQYEVKSTASLTLAEWLGLKEVRHNWAKGICDMNWGNGVCARIQARKDMGADIEPTQEEVMAVFDSKKWSTTTDDIIAAFDSGKEKMGVWTLKCIDYDHHFQLELYDRYPTWTPPESKKTKKGKHTKGMKEEVEVKEVKKKVKVKVKVKVKEEDGILSPAKASRRKKRKHSEGTSESGTEWMKDEAEVMMKVDDEEKALINIRRLGTKSRTRL